MAALKFLLPWSDSARTAENVARHSVYTLLEAVAASEGQRPMAVAAAGSGSGGVDPAACTVGHASLEQTVQLGSAFGDSSERT